MAGKYGEEGCPQAVPGLPGRQMESADKTDGKENHSCGAGRRGGALPRQNGIQNALVLGTNP